MARVYQVPQHAFIWLMTGAVLACVPHLFAGPPWLVVVTLVLQGWRILVQRGRLRMPGRFIRLPLLAFVLLATLYTFGTVMGAEAGVTLLICAFNLKLLEMFKLRDAYVAIVLCYFVLATVLLVHQGFFVTLYVLLVLVVVTAALIGINQPEANVRARQQIRYAFALSLQALPLMVFLFFVVPRVPPLWELPTQKKAAKTGMSDSMALGEVSELSRSDELAFRVRFYNEVPPPAQRYWRGLTYSWFDGQRWTQAVPRNLPRREYVASTQLVYQPDWYAQLLDSAQGRFYEYQVLLEPTQREWMYTLTTPVVSMPGVLFARDHRLVFDGPINEPLPYRVRSYPQVTRGLPLPDWEREINLALPPQINPQTRALAQRWLAEAGGDQEAFINRLMRWFREEAFYYTLTPPALGQQQIDDFLFRTRSGFCEHYASSMTFALRAAGVPARIVAGYQGGQFNPMGTHMIVRQYDAHAWVEAWLPGRGWVEFDPTFMVAPERVELGLEQALQSQGAEFAQAFNDIVGFGRLPLMSQLNNVLDYMEYLWIESVLNYNADKQQSLFKRLLGEVTTLRIALLIGAGVLVIAVIMAVAVLWLGRAPATTWWQQEYWRLHRQLVRRGIPVGEDAGPRTLAQIMMQHAPGEQARIQAWLALYTRIAYREAELEQAPGPLRRKLRQLRRRLVRAMP